MHIFIKPWVQKKIVYDISESLFLKIRVFLSKISVGRLTWYSLWDWFRSLREDDFIRLKELAFHKLKVISPLREHISLCLREILSRAESFQNFNTPTVRKITSLRLTISRILLWLLARRLHYLLLYHLPVDFLACFRDSIISGLIKWILLAKADDARISAFLMLKKLLSIKL